MTENQEMWLQEQGETAEETGAEVGLRSVGITPGGISSDIEAIDSIPAPAGPEAGAEGGLPQPGAAPGPATAAGRGRFTRFFLRPFRKKQDRSKGQYH